MKKIGLAIFSAGFTKMPASKKSLLGIITFDQKGINQYADNDFYSLGHAGYWNGTGIIAEKTLCCGNIVLFGELNKTFKENHGERVGKGIVFRDTNEKNEIIADIGSKEVADIFSASDCDERNYIIKEIVKF